jgi:hypothetical protein
MYKNKNEIYIQRKQVYDLTLLDYALKSLYAIYMLFTNPPLILNGRVGHGENKKFNFPNSNSTQSTSQQFPFDSLCLD